MKKSLLSLFLLAMLVQTGLSQHTISLEGFAFVPNDLTINIGETVTWDCTQGSHNVNGSTTTFPGNPEGFSSGAVATAPWQFSHTFTVPGVYEYRCDPHVSLGMAGTITVSAPAAGDVIITEIMYNPPSLDTLEFLELYNNGSDPVEMENWTLSDAVDFTFPQFVLMPGDFAIVSNNADGFQSAFGISGFEFSGALNNSGEPIVLTDASGTQVDVVEYSSSSPWPDGQNKAIVLCDFNTDNNDAANWASAITNTGVTIGTTDVLANPGAVSDCSDTPMVGFLTGGGFSISEGVGSVMVEIVLSNGNAGTFSVDLAMDMSSTAVNGQDFSLSLPTTVTFEPGAAMDTQTVVINLIDDMDVESTETLSLFLENPSNGAELGQSTFGFEILDNDGAITNALVITGVFDAQPGGAGAKGVELKALQDINDLSTFGVGSASNGGGSDGQEITLPTISVDEGDCIYVAADSTMFFEYFGFYPIATGTGVSINGDDAIELFENNMVIDVFGEINHSGGALDWSYQDGWAYRKIGTGPDGIVFEMDNWNFSGIGALSGFATNNEVETPFPYCSYQSDDPTSAVANDYYLIVPYETSVVANVLANDLTPNALTSMTVTNGPSNGTATVNGLDDITYSPDAGFCGADAFTYEICDGMGCDEAVVVVNVECPPAYPVYDIATVTTVDADGIPDSLEVFCQIQGIVHGIDFQGGDDVQFVIIDGTGGISLYSENDFGYTVQEGDEVIVQGEITDFNCLTQITPDTLWSVSNGNTLTDTDVTTFLDESFESEMVRFTNVQLVDPAEWLGDGSGFNVTITNGTFENVMRIDDDTEMANQPWTHGTNLFAVNGIGGQYDNEGICDDGYQFLPRYWADFDFGDNTVDKSLSEKITFYPNPVSDRLFIETKEVNLEKITVSNMIGQNILEVENPSNSLVVSELQSGIYTLTFHVGETIWASRFVKN